MFASDSNEICEYIGKFDILLADLNYVHIISAEVELLIKCMELHYIGA